MIATALTGLRYAKFRTVSARLRCARIGLVALVLVIAFASRNAAAFRSGRDASDLAKTDRVKFAGNTIAFSLQKDLPKGLNLAAVEAQISSATAAWSAPECSALSFSYQGRTADHAAPGDGVNTIEWISSWSSHGFPADAPGATDVQYELRGDRWTIVEADLYLNRDYSWTTGTADDSMDREVAAVVTHEAGHMLGLLHPCEPSGADGAPACGKEFVDSYAGSAMYPFYSATEAHLAQDDIDGVCFLYPKGTCPDSGCADGETCTPGGCAVVCGDQICEAGDACTESGCAEQSNCGLASCAGIRCLTDAGCGRFDTCVAGTCVHGERPNGDPCATDTDCYEGACLEGVCTTKCTVDGECAPGKACDTAASACNAPLHALGESCTTGSECTGGLCVSGAGQSAMCSRACGKGQPVCPAGWVCDQADGKNACAPDPTSRGCSVSPRIQGDAGARSIGTLVFLFAVLAARQGRARRNHGERS